MYKKIDNCYILRLTLQWKRITALTCFIDDPVPPSEKLTMDIYPYILIISSIFLIMTFIVYAILPEIRNIHGVTIMCHVASLAVMYIGLATIQLGSSLPQSSCVILGKLDSLMTADHDTSVCKIPAVCMVRLTQS